ncbi:MAG: efflux RND transporter periplasmic adaptor subunit [Rhodocyclaceae bacterium]
MTLQENSFPGWRRLTAFLPVLVVLAACGQAVPPPEPLRPVLTRVLGESSGETTGKAASKAAGSETGSEGATYSGEVRSRYETALGFRIPGKISARLVDAGAQVKAGDVLARLDPADTALSAAAADAQLVLADAEARRYRDLRTKNFVSAAALDAREAALKSAQAQASLAHNQGGYTLLKADQAGVVALVAGEAGQVVAAGQTVFRVARPDTLEVAIAIPESRMPGVRALGEAEITLWSDDKASFRGVLRELSAVADPATRTYAARVAIVAPDRRVLLGMTANVHFRRTGGDARLSVPLTAIFQKDGKPALWVVDAGQSVALRPVEIASYGETSALLAGGVSAGERVVVAGVHKLSAGEKVKVAEAAPAR